MNRVVVITGGGTGVGAACARLLAAQGDRVFIIGRRPEPLAALAQEIGAQALVGDAASGELEPRAAAGHSARSRAHRLPDR